jgi:hypothetical protein
MRGVANMIDVDLIGSRILSIKKATRKTQGYVASPLPMLIRTSSPEGAGLPA